MKETRAIRILARTLPLLAMIGLFIAAETILRVKRGPPPPDPAFPEFDYYYSDIYKPMFKRIPQGEDGGPVFVTNRARLSHQEFAAVKPKDTFRIFVVGGSVAIAYAPPNKKTYRPPDDAREGLLNFLRRIFPGKNFELIGCGMGGYDSYRDSLVQKEILNYQPDAVVLMSGNNEYLTPETASPALYHMMNRFRKLWVFRLALDRLKSRRPTRRQTIQDRLANFEKNLKAMAERAKEKNVPMIFCTLPANIRGLPPVQSLPPLGDTDYIAARAALDSSDDALASQEFGRYVQAHPDEPFGQYWLARLLERRRLFAQAREHFLRAVDLDDPGERCSSWRNEIIRRVAKDTGMIVADLDAAFDGAAEEGLPDFRIFVDACHWRKEYYPLASWTILRSIDDSSRSGGHSLLAAERGEWGWFESEGARVQKPAISARRLNEYGDEAIYKAMTYGAEQSGRISEGAVALLEGAVRRDPARLDYLGGSFAHLGPAFKKYVWLNDSADEMREHWSDISLQIGEAYRRERQYAKALRYFDGVLRSSPGQDTPLLLKAMTLAAMGRLPEARTCLDHISAESNGTREFAYWRAKIGGAAQ